MIISAHDIWPEVVARFEFPGRFVPVTGRTLKERFSAIKANYRRHQAMVDAGISSWFGDDPYEVGEWPSIFTPIESSLWTDIRCYGLDLWPQLPVGRFFVDFGNPVAKVAIECDGKEFHQDKAKDDARDAELEAMGWEVLRIPGWQCNGRILDRDEAELKGIDDIEGWNDQRTPYTTLMYARSLLDGPKQRAGMVCRARLKARLARVHVEQGQGNGAGASGDFWATP